MSRSACQWPALTTKRRSASSPRAPRAGASLSMRLRCSITARRPRRRAAGQTANARTHRHTHLLISTLAIQRSIRNNVHKLQLFCFPRSKDVHILLCPCHFYVSLGLRINSECIMYAVDTKSSHPFSLFPCPTFLLKP